MPRRPFYVTWVGVLLLFWGIREVVFLCQVLNIAITHGVVLEFLSKAPVAMAIASAGAAIELACGIGVLCRANWARWLWSVWWTVSLIFNMASGRTGEESTAAVMLEVVTTIVIFLPGANAYFSPGEHEDR